MPPKQKQKQTAKQKQQVKQVVNVRVGDIKAKRKAAPRRRAALPEPAPALLRQGPPVNVSLSTQSYMPSQPSYLNEYNTLLKQMAEEKAARSRAAPPLAPNTVPLTINQQRNELLNRIEAAMQTNALAVPLKNVVETQTYDDPLSDENMFVNSSRLGENIAPKLPVTNFDYNDVNNYAAEAQDIASSIVNEIIDNVTEDKKKNALADIATQTNKKKQKFIVLDDSGTQTNIEAQDIASSIVNEIVGKATRKPRAKSTKPTRDELLEQTNAKIRLYNAETNDNIRLLKKNTSKRDVITQNRRIEDLIMDRGIKMPKSL